jgi:hypothetical protein
MSRANSLGDLSASLLSHSPQLGMLLHPSTDICLKELARDMREFLNSLLGPVRSRLRATFAEASHAEGVG